MKLQTAILDLERRTGYPTIPGTQIVRCQVARSILAKEAPEIKIPEDKEGMFVWSLGLGVVHEPKIFWYGETIISAVLKAQKGMAELESLALVDRKRPRGHRGKR